MKRYFKRFWVWYAIILIMFLIYLPLRFKNTISEDITFIRSNQEALTDERVFDMADKLTNDEEEALRNLIEEKQDEIGCDIVLITLNDSSLNTDKKMMEFADWFCIDNKLGYNKPVGDAVVYVDNWYNGYCWLCTSGKAENRYSNTMIDNVIGRVCAVVNDDAYKGYSRYVDQVAKDMQPKAGFEELQISSFAIAIVAFFITTFYLVIALSGQKGKKTTTPETYVSSTGEPALYNEKDIFITKHLTKRTIDTSSGGGGGGHHSTGGHSFGGGGGRH